jgi:hypothetical protein
MGYLPFKDSARFSGIPYEDCISTSWPSLLEEKERWKVMGFGALAQRVSSSFHAMIKENALIAAGYLESAERKINVCKQRQRASLSEECCEPCNING